jgi:hypothetical protein
MKAPFPMWQREHSPPVSRDRASAVHLQIYRLQVRKLEVCAEFDQEIARLRSMLPHDDLERA